MLLESDFTIGFEIEAIAFEPNYQRIKDIFREFSDKSKDKEERLFFISGDSSISIDQDIQDLSEYEVYDENNNVKYFNESIVPFEIDTGYMTLNPRNKKELIQLLLAIYFEGIMSNNTCSLHVHIKPKHLKIDSIQARFFSNMLLAYIVESELYNKYLLFDNQKMYNEEWSSVDNMIEEYNIFKKRYFENIEYVYNKKYDYRQRGLFHVHQQGTLEWRGNRGLFDYNPVMFSHKSLKTFEDNIKKHLSFIFKLIKDLTKVANGKVNLPKTDDSVYWRLFNYKNIVYSKR